MPRPHHREDPHHPEHAHAYAGDDRGKHRTSGAPHGSGEYLHRHEQHVERHRPRHDIRPQPDHSRVGGVNFQNEGTERDDQRAHRPRQHHAHTHADPDALTNPVVFLRAEVLPHEGGHRYAESAGDHPSQAVGLNICRPCRHRHVPEGIDAGLYQKIGKVKCHELQSRRDANVKDAFQQPALKADLFQREPCFFRLTEQRHRDHPRADHLREDRRDGSPRHAQLQHHHAQDVQHDVDPAGSHQEHGRFSGIAHGPENARAHVVEHGGDRPAKIDFDVQNGVVHAAFRGVHQPQNFRAEGVAQRHHHRAQHKRQRHAGMEGILHALLTFRAVKLGQQHRRAGAQSDEKAVHQVQQCGGSPHRRQRPGADEPADDDGVHGIVHLLEKAPKQNGKEKEKQLLPDHALRNALRRQFALHKKCLPTDILGRFYHRNGRLSIDFFRQRAPCPTGGKPENRNNPRPAVTTAAEGHSSAILVSNICWLTSLSAE